MYRLKTSITLTLNFDMLPCHGDTICNKVVVSLFVDFGLDLRPRTMVLSNSTAPYGPVSFIILKNILHAPGVHRAVFEKHTAPSKSMKQTQIIDGQGPYSRGQNLQKLSCYILAVVRLWSW